MVDLSSLKVVALAGGVGGAKLADGLAQVLPPEHLTIIVNTGDDFEHLGLQICPDLDTVCYTLAGLANAETGWGRRDETWQVLANLSRLGAPDWFRLGDQDLATHIERTRRLSNGESLTAITRDFCRSWNIGPTVLPMTDEPAPTIVRTAGGPLPFQEYFVHRRCEPVVTGFRFEGDPAATPAVTRALSGADLVILCPSNPWVSIDPIRQVAGIQEWLDSRPVIAVSPIIGGAAVKGPAAKMYAELGITPSAAAVASHYAGWLDGFVLDQVDAELAPEIEAGGPAVLVTSTWMKSPSDRRELALAVLEFRERLNFRMNVKEGTTR